MNRSDLNKIYLIEEEMNKLAFDIKTFKEEAIKLNDKIDQLEDKKNKLEQAFYPLVNHLTQPLREGGKLKNE